MDCNRNIIRKLRESRILNERRDYDNMDRDELILLAKEKDQLAISTLIRKHQDFLNRMIRKYVPEGATFDRDDILQFAELAFWEAIQKWDMTGNFEAFAGMVIKRRVTDELRKLDTDKRIVNRDTPSLDSLHDTDDDDGVRGQELTNGEFRSWISKQTPSAEDEYMNKNSDKELVKFIAEEFTDIERSVVELYIKGYKMAQIAEELQMKYKSCENALMRAKGKLRAFLRDRVKESRKLKESDDFEFTADEKRRILKAISAVNRMNNMEGED